MKNLVPQLILSNYKDNISNGCFSAFTMFIDISGFTQMTESLMKNGKEGAEVLISNINDVFTPAIDLIHQSGGFISTFGGDAFITIFRNTEAENVIVTAVKIQQLFQEKNILDTKFGKFPISVKIGLSYGDLCWNIVINQAQNSYYFKGQAIKNCCNSEKKANENQIVFDKSFSDKSKHLTICYESLDPQFFLFERLDYKEALKNDNLEFNLIDTDKEFYPKSIYSLNIKGEFRHVVSIFISFEEAPDLNEKISKIIDTTYQLGGYFNRVSFGDKGRFILIFFGAPLSKEKPHIRAAKLALMVSKMLNLKTKIGMTFGPAFAGFSGSDTRSEYTCQSSKVNLAARLMNKAKIGEILVDEELENEIKNHFKTSSSLRGNFKGYIDQISYYNLISEKKSNTKQLFENKFVGREKELQELKDTTAQIMNNRFAGVVYINGSAGIGKSRLVDELRKDLNSKVNWIEAPCDEVHRNSLNPFKYFLSRYFDQNFESDKEVNKLNFENKFTELLGKIEDESLKAEMLRTKSFLAALINIFWKDSLFEQIDSKGKQENSFSAIKNLIKAESKYKPIIINLEDGHWIDSESKKLLNVLVTNVKEYPFVIISSCRFNDDGSAFSFELNEVNEKHIEIKHLTETGTSILINELMKEVIPEKSKRYIFKKSEGNPFFIEQIVLFLKENDLFDHEFYIKEKNFEIPAGINAIVTSRIDKLTNELKNIVKTASVLGREFTVKILSNMLKNRSLDSFLESGEKQAIWVALNELNYLFKHALIRETVYEMQLKTRLRDLHKLAGNTIENLFSEKLNAYYEELANHYYKAEDFDKATEYLEKAGDQAKASYQNEKALDFYDKLIGILENKLETFNKT